MTLTPEQERFDRQMTPTCVCCNRPLSPPLTELTHAGQHGFGCERCVAALSEEDCP